MKALVTGATGFVGAAVARALARIGVDVRVLARPDSDLRNLDGLPVERVAGDLRDPASLRTALAGWLPLAYLNHWLVNLTGRPPRIPLEGVTMAKVVADGRPIRSSTIHQHPLAILPWTFSSSSSKPFPSDHTFSFFLPRFSSPPSS